MCSCARGGGALVVGFGGALMCTVLSGPADLSEYEILDE